tara:strand:- start:231 stop:725 length:495 start_codon:yes stop_codon:yes gene_type:complete
MNSNELVTEFNRILDEFVSKMINQFPDQTNFVKYDNLYKIGKIVDKTLPIKIFMGGCIQFTDEIKQKNENFFKNRSNFVTSCSKIGNFSSDIGLIEYWDKIVVGTKEAIWQYIQTLFALGSYYMKINNLVNDDIEKYYNKWAFKYCDDSLKDNRFSSEYLTKIN